MFVGDGIFSLRRQEKVETNQHCRSHARTHFAERRCSLKTTHTRRVVTPLYESGTVIGPSQPIPVHRLRVESRLLADLTHSTISGRVRRLSSPGALARGSARLFPNKLHKESLAVSQRHDRENDTRPDVKSRCRVGRVKPRNSKSQTTGLTLTEENRL